MGTTASKPVLAKHQAIGGYVRRMTAEAANFDPGDAPKHQCINASCHCNDLVGAGGCGEWCMANTTEASDVERGKDTLKPCQCAHATCKAGGPRGTPERGMS